MGRRRLTKPKTGKPPINENWSEYLLRVGAQAMFDNPNSERAIEFRKYANRVARQANKQLAALKKQGMTHFGYEKAQVFTKRVYGTTRFKTGTKMQEVSPQDLYHQTLSVQRFLNYATATPEGYIEQIDIRKKKIAQMLEKRGIKNVEDKDLTSFLWILSDEDIRRVIKEQRGKSKEASEEIVELIHGAYQETSLDEIKGLFQLYNEAKEESGLNLDQTGFFNIEDLKKSLTNRAYREEVLTENAEKIEAIMRKREMLRH